MRGGGLAGWLSMCALLAAASAGVVSWTVADGAVTLYFGTAMVLEYRRDPARFHRRMTSREAFAALAGVALMCAILVVVALVGV